MERTCSAETKSVRPRLRRGLVAFGSGSAALALVTGLAACTATTPDQRREAQAAQASSAAATFRRVPMPTVSPTPSPMESTAQATPSPTASASETPSPSPTASASETPSASPTPSHSAASPKPKPTVKPAATPTASPDSRAKRDAAATAEVSRYFINTCRVMVAAYRDGNADKHDYVPFRAGLQTGPTGSSFVSWNRAGSNTVGAVFESDRVSVSHCSAIMVSDSPVSYQRDTYIASGETASTDTSVIGIYSRQQADPVYDTDAQTLRYPTVRISNDGGRPDLQGMSGTYEYDDAPDGYSTPVTVSVAKVLPRILDIMDDIQRGN